MFFSRTNIIPDNLKSIFPEKINDIDISINDIKTLLDNVPVSLKRENLYNKKLVGIEKPLENGQFINMNDVNPEVLKNIFEYNIIKNKSYDIRILFKNAFRLDDINNVNLVLYNIKLYISDIKNIIQGNIYSYGTLDFYNISNFFSVKYLKYDKNDLRTSTEYGIGLILNTIKNEIPNFIYTYYNFQCNITKIGNTGILYTDDEINKSDIIVFENVYNSISFKEYLKECTFEEFLNIIIQCFLALSYANKKYDFIHGFLTVDNIIISKLDQNISIKYLLNGNLIYYTTNVIVYIKNFNYSIIRDSDSTYTNADLYFYKNKEYYGTYINDFVTLMDSVYNNIDYDINKIDTKKEIGNFSFSYVKNYYDCYDSDKGCEVDYDTDILLFTKISISYDDIINSILVNNNNKNIFNRINIYVQSIKTYPEILNDNHEYSNYFNLLYNIYNKPPINFKDTISFLTYYNKTNNNKLILNENMFINDINNLNNYIESYIKNLYDIFDKAKFPKNNSIYIASNNFGEELTKLFDTIKLYKVAEKNRLAEYFFGKDVIKDIDPGKRELINSIKYFILYNSKMINIILTELLKVNDIFKIDNEEIINNLTEIQKYYDNVII